MGFLAVAVVLAQLAYPQAHKQHWVMAGLE
jgi:hypothetical protein